MSKGRELKHAGMIKCGIEAEYFIARPSVFYMNKRCKLYCSYKIVRKYRLKYSVDRNQPNQTIQLF